jgi:hypothetical protein
MEGDHQELQDEAPSKKSVVLAQLFLGARFASAIRFGHWIARIRGRR